jgi:lon-related putative ATP-dependent protease
MSIRRLEPAALFQHCDEQDLDFETTADLQDLEEIIGQPRAVEATKFGIGIRRNGYNLFALGPAGSGRRSLVQRYAEQRAEHEPLPPDWCYVNNFQQSDKPRVLALPAGRGVELRDDMEQLIEDLHAAIPAGFESSEYRTRAQGIEEDVNQQQEAALKKIQASAERKDISLIQTPTGFTLAPVRDGKTLSLEEFQKLPEDERRRIEKDTAELQEQLGNTLREVPKWQKQGRDRMGRLNREMAGATVSHLIEALLHKYAGQQAVVAYLDEVREDVVNGFRHFLQEEERKSTLFGMPVPGQGEGPPWLNRYRVNILVSHSANHGAPVIYEDHPSYNNLLGRVEHQAQLGALMTDFTMVRAGALHRANGGYLILDALKVLTQPFAWDALKRTLQAGEIRIESLAQLTSLISTVSVEPEPIPLDVKVILLGERHIYYLLAQLDPEFDELFKVAVDFDDRMERSAESQQLYARLIAGIVRREKLRHFDRSAVARVIEQSARVLGDSERLATHMRSLADLLQEADYWAAQRAADNVDRSDVQRAIDTRIYRVDRIRERIQEEIRRGTLLIDTQGSRAGQVNGLSVLGLGNFMFGRPARITAQVRLGDNQVVDIEREVELGGPIHSKGVFILSAFIGSRYLPDQPLALSASLVFEQSYGEVEGDSASAAELFALLSALADAPLRQSLAVTGSVNQHGEIQPIGGVNEKIEGFFDVCVQRGLNGEQGVIIPATNVRHLMLREDVLAAVEAGRFAVYAIDHVDDGMELLTGVAAGQRDVDGRFPEPSINARVEARLALYAEGMRAFAGRGKEGEDTGQLPQ